VPWWPGIGPEDPFDAGASFVVANLTTLLPVAVLVFGAGAIGDLIDDGSLVYVWLRPIPTRLPVLAAWAATVTIVIPLVAVPVLLGTALLEPAPELLGATALALVVGTLAYAALAVMVGSGPPGAAVGLATSVGGLRGRCREHGRTPGGAVLPARRSWPRWPTTRSDWVATPGQRHPRAVVVGACRGLSQRLARTDVP
jgi:hypothetical protein